MRIEFNNVSFSYEKKQKKAIDNINLVLDKSEIVFIMGSTGSGKSTLLQHINGLLLCDEGKVGVEFNNKKFNLSKDYKEKKLNDLRKEVGFVFQFSEYQLFETSVLKDVMFSPFNFYKDEEKAKQMAIDSLNKMRIDESYYERSPFDLSGGEKRKVAIAGVLASNPSVIILDEPTSSLDSFSSKEIMELVKTLKEDGKLVIVVSHDTDLCYEYADRVIIMNDGKIIKDSRVDEAFEDDDVLKKANLERPFIDKVKRTLKIKNSSVRCIGDLKEVFKNG